MAKSKQKYDRPSYKMMNDLHEKWIRNPVGTQANFFLEYGWTRDEFFSSEVQPGFED